MQKKTQKHNAHYMSEYIRYLIANTILFIL